MGEIKSVKVDNWGVFFLQKLQNFFNKTDYCDLTLQFNDNSQLKVHRLVLSACTDYFNVLEQTCEVIDDALIMPIELQADVVVPIVNFMYTGTLEFELKMYGKLLRTAKEMNMTVLLKLLEAHRRTMEGVNRTQCPSSPKTGVRKRGPITTTTTQMTAQVRSVSNSSQVQQQRRILPTSNASATRRVVQTKSTATNVAQPQVQQYQQVASTSLLKVSPAVSISPQKLKRSTYEENKSNEMGSTIPTYDSSMQFKEEQQDEYDHALNTVNRSTSPFEQLRKGYNNNKRPASATFISPPAKKPNIEDVKEFAEQQRVRKQIAAEYGEDQEYESTLLDDDIHNDDDDDDTAAAVASSSTTTSAATTTTATLSTAVASAKQQTQSPPSIIIKQEPNEKPTIVVKDSSNSKMNHAKIISEVLRQYPHLVKSNKSIKLKIMPNIGGQSQKIIVKKEHIENISGEVNIQSVSASSGTQSQTILKPVQQQAEHQQILLKPAEKSFPAQQTLSNQKTATAQPTASTTTAKHDAAAKTATVAQPQKRRIDSKTMHALIALGAENTTGPWLCLRCGVNGRPISIPSYRGFRRHLINTHKETIDEALCEHCGWRSTTNRELHFHIHVEHKIKTTLYTFPECLMCAEVFIDTNTLNQHMIESHPDENQQQCIYCNKIFAKEIQLFTHMKTYHKKQAVDDGIIDYSEDEDDDVHDDDDDDCDEDEDEGEAMDTTQEKTVADECVEEKQNSSSSTLNMKNKKIKILSDISLPSAGSLMKLESSRDTASGALTEITSGINLQTSEGLISSTHGNSKNETLEIGKEPKFVSADGNEMVLTDEQRKEIMSQLNQEHEGGVVMVLNESAFADGVDALPNTNEETSADQPTTVQESTDHLEDSGEGQHAADTSTNEVEEEEEEDDEEEYNDNNIYDEFATKSDDIENKESSSSVLDESKGSMENLEWAENLITAHELEGEEEEEDHPSKTSSKQAEIIRPTEKNLQDLRKNEDISQKLKELTGDWSDDEIDDVLDDAVVKPTTDYCTREDVKDKDQDDKVIVEEARILSVKEDEMDKENSKKGENMSGILTEANPIDKGREKEPEDDIDMALKSLHKEDIAVKLEDLSDETTSANVLPRDEVSNVEMQEDTDENVTDSSKNPLELEPAAVKKQAHQSTTDEITSISKHANENQNNQCAVEKDIKVLKGDEEDKEKCKLDQLYPDKDREEKASTSAMHESNSIVNTATELESAVKDIKVEEPVVTNEPSESVTKSKTEEKIKSLMSEWVDDDDDDDDEIEEIGTIE